MDNLQELYERYGFPSKQKLYEIAKAEGDKYKMKDIENFLNKQETFQLHRKKKKHRHRPITTGKPVEQFQMDLLDMSKFYHENQGYKWILISVDVFSRKAAAFPMKKKTAEECLTAVKKVIEAMGKPDVIVTDSGSEFKGAVHQYFKNNGIIHRVTEPLDHNVLGVVDRFSQTLKSTIFKYFTYNDNTKWVDILPKIIEYYNKKPHSTLGMSPNDAAKYPTEVRRIYYAKIQQAEKGHVLQVGDTVKIKIIKPTFSKGYTINWSLQNYKIVAIHGLYYELDNGKQYRADALLKVQPTKKEAKKDIVKASHQRHRTEQLLKAEDIQEKNITRQLRQRKPTSQLITDEGERVIFS